MMYSLTNKEEDQIQNGSMPIVGSLPGSLPTESASGSGIRSRISSQHRPGVAGIVIHTVGRGGAGGRGDSILGFADLDDVYSTIGHADAVVVLLIVDGDPLAAAVRHERLVDTKI